MIDERQYIVMVQYADGSVQRKSCYKWSYRLFGVKRLGQRPVRAFIPYELKNNLGLLRGIMMAMHPCHAREIRYL